MDDKEKQQAANQETKENDEDYAEAEEDYEDDGEADIGEELTEERLREMGIDPATLNDEGPADNRSWVSVEDGQDIQAEMSDDDMDVSVISYSDKIRKVFMDHTDAVVAMEVVNGAVFTGGMDDRLVKWSLDNTDSPVGSVKVASS